MAALYIVSAEEAAGKTAVCAGLGKFLQGNGKKVGFLKPLTAGTNVNGDTVFMKIILDLPEPAESLCPPLSEANKVKEAYDKVSQGKDVVIVEGGVGPSPDDSASRASYEIAKAISARMIVVEAYREGASGFINVYKGFGGSLLGVILNKVPQSQLKRVQSEGAKQFSAAGINMLGALPEDRVLFTITVGELAENIQGKVLNNAEKSTELVENFMLGAMVVDSGLSYFGRKSHKAAIVRQDRPDMQLAALETSTNCLVLSGSNKPPVYNVLEKAENRGIPIISTELGASDIVTNIDSTLRKSRFTQEKKLPRLADVMKQHLNLQSVLL
ncbi:MAG: hypothetical protein A2144_01725 [Chloroflexi bacterium RBG_16_50_9]|nr:MAG: hypothetical protein A2144_01725 [Chloroflexi bacterium RBG_16_50_9]